MKVRLRFCSAALLGFADLLARSCIASNRALLCTGTYATFAWRWLRGVLSILQIRQFSAVLAASTATAGSFALNLL